MQNNETALEMCLRMLRERARFFQSCQCQYDEGIGSGYAVAVILLEYAMQGDIERLNQLDWYHK